MIRNGTDPAGNATAIAVTPTSATVAVGATQPYSAIGTFPGSAHYDISDVVAWTSSASTVASISALGVATGAVAGGVTITAALDQVSSSATLTVTGVAPSPSPASSPSPAPSPSPGTSPSPSPGASPSPSPASSPSPSPTPPTLTRLSASSGLIGTTVPETLTGTEFVTGATVNVSGGGVTVSNVTVVNATTITANFFIDPTATVSARPVTVTTGGQTSGSQTFTVSNTNVTVVTLSSDTNSGGAAGTGAGVAGDLRSALLNAAAGGTIVFNLTPMPGVITLTGPLPPVTQDVSIDGGFFGRVTIDGGGSFRAFFVDRGTVTLANLQIKNASAREAPALTAVAAAWARAAACS